MSGSPSLPEIQEAFRNGRLAEAEEMLRGFLSDLFPISIQSVAVRRDTLSLNSVNGFIDLNAPEPKSGSTKLFFKFHREENEEAVKEYYNSKLLEENGYPTEMPLYASHEVGKQVLIYPYKDSERMADLCKRLDAPDAPYADSVRVVRTQARLDALCAERYLASLHEAPLQMLRDEPILQLFYHRLVDKDRPGLVLGGRYKQFYAGKIVELPGGYGIPFEGLSALRWRINGVQYDETLASAFARALAMLTPVAHALPGKFAYPAVVAHGDAHNGNVWYNLTDPPSLSLFDPAFAGPHIPALLAEIKPTFHNIFAHPLWLYDAREEDEKLHLGCTIRNGFIEITHDWQLSWLRRGFLDSKRNNLWKPLLNAMRERDMLPSNWQTYMRSALFCCPTLVMNLRANEGNANNSHTPKTSLLGFAISIMLASAPVDKHDIVSKFFAELE